jgi:hypothetical protein
MQRKSVWIFIEGEGGAQGEGRFRKAWQKFLGPIHEHAKSVGVLYGFRAVPCGNGEAAMKRFLNPRPGEEDGLRILLVDSEEKRVDNVAKPWAALNVTPPEGVSDDDAYLMVRCLEAWLVTDVEAIRKHYDGAGKARFKSDKIGLWANPEKVEKLTLFSALNAAVADCVRNARWDHARANLVVEFMSLEKLAEHQHMRAPKRFFYGVKERISMYAKTDA